MNNGKIFLVGFGPGSEAQMTFRAKEAIKEADVVVGYSTYIKLVEDLLEGKEVIKKGMTEEIDRCVLAYDKAKEGHKVALISSGDIGVYGMAGPTFEVLFDQGWTPETGLEVEVVPGTTALSASASLVGAPLTHDFCSISLSDLLTPWPVIASRLEGAAKADFVVALYNPKSGRRVGQIVEAQEILLRYKSPETPVAIVKSAYRKRQQINLVTLGELKDQDIGMLTTVLIGNSKTFFRDGLMITPRGYSNKYEDLTGQAKEGEQAGRSLSLGLDGFIESASAALEAGKDLGGWAKSHSVSLGYLLDLLARHQPEAISLFGPQDSSSLIDTPKQRVHLETSGGIQVFCELNPKEFFATETFSVQGAVSLEYCRPQESRMYLIKNEFQATVVFVIGAQGNLDLKLSYK